MVFSDVKWFKKIIKFKGLILNWLECYVVYVVGFGIFSLNEGFIIEKGMVIRLVFVIIELKFELDVREVKNYMGNCLYYNNGICGVCIKRCFVNVFFKEGYNKWKCYYCVYVVIEKKFGVL